MWFREVARCFKITKQSFKTRNISAPCVLLRIEVHFLFALRNEKTLVMCKSCEVRSTSRRFSRDQCPLIFQCKHKTCTSILIFMLKRRKPCKKSNKSASIFPSRDQCLSLENICHSFLMLHYRWMRWECKYFRLFSSDSESYELVARSVNQLPTQKCPSLDVWKPPLLGDCKCKIYLTRFFFQWKIETFKLLLPISKLCGTLRPAHICYFIGLCVHITRRVNTRGKARRGGAEVAGWTLDRKIRVRFPAYPHRVWALWWQEGKRRIRTSRCPCRGRPGTLKTPSCPWRGCPAAGQTLETGHLSRHYIAEISLNVTLNHNQQQQQQEEKIIRGILYYTM